MYSTFYVLNISFINIYIAPLNFLFLLQRTTFSYCFFRVLERNIRFRNSCLGVQLDSHPSVVHLGMLPQTNRVSMAKDIEDSYNNVCVFNRYCNLTIVY